MGFDIFDLSGRVAIITGGGTGTGAAIARLSGPNGDTKIHSVMNQKASDNE